MTSTLERTVDIEAVRIPYVRNTYGDLGALMKSLRSEGPRHPVTLWKDGTLISGGRRHRAHLLLASRRIQAVFVDTIEDAAKAIRRDNDDDDLLVPLKATEMCRLWELLRRFDAPAAVIRAREARRRGIELRRQTLDGTRKPGRDRGTSEDYVLGLLAPAYGMSESTARRLWAIYSHATGIMNTTDEKADRARQALKSIDLGESAISANYISLISGGPAPAARQRPAARQAVPAARQQAAWGKSLPQMEGLVAGLAELGPPNADLTWDEVGPVHDRLAAVRRDLEKMIKQMRESTKP